MSIKIFVVILLSFISMGAHAVTECPVTISKLYVGDDAEILWLNYKQGGSASITSSESNFKNILSVVLAAKMADKNLIVRYEADNVSCAGEHRKDIRGVWLL